jgi:hypothetical protein
MVNLLADIGVSEVRYSQASELFLQRKGYYEASLRNYDAQIASAGAELQTNTN